MSYESVVVEWQANTPYTPETLREASGAVSWCHRLYDVTHLRSYLGNGGRDIVCIFAAPDAEAVRRAGRQSGSPVHTVWTAQVVASPDASLTPADGRTAVLVGRRFDQPADFDALQAMEEKGGWCLREHGVRHLRSYIAQDCRRLLCLYEAPDAEAVRTAQRRIGMPFEHIQSTTVCLWSEAPAQ